MTTVRTIKLKRIPQGTTEAVSLNAPAPEAAPEGSDTQATSAAQPATPSAPAPQVVAGANVSGKSYLPYTIAASVVVVLFLVIMGIQYSEISLYQAEPSVWIRK